LSSVQARCVIVLQISVEPEGLKMKEPMYSSNLTIPGVIVRAVLTNELHSNAAVVQTAIVAGQNNTVGQRSISWRSADPVP